MRKLLTVVCLLAGWFASISPGLAYRDLETGTFITRDPAGFVDGPNMYAYVVQNPWTKFDPDGLELIDSNAIYSSMAIAQGTGQSVQTVTQGQMAANSTALKMTIASAPFLFVGPEVAGARGLGALGRVAIAGFENGGAGATSHAIYSGLNGEFPTAKGMAESGAISGTIGAGAQAVGEGIATVLNSESKAAVASTPTQSASEVSTLNAPEVQAQLKASALSKGNTYSDLVDPPGVTQGKDFSASQLAKAKQANLQRNGGILRDDVTGEVMAPSKQTTKGSKVDPTSVQGDHVIPKKPKNLSVTPGSNSYQNLKLRRAEYNRRKSNN